jgi:hypothetical protein
MTPTPDFSENRRSFVKKTLATTVTISFAGLIRAHGEGTTGSTSNPDETTACTTDSGGTTTWNPEETTSITTGGSETTTWNPDETFDTTEVNTTSWNPDETTLVTTIVSTTERLSSLQKQPPDGGQESPDIPGSYFKKTILMSEPGLIEIKAGNNIVLRLDPKWQVEIEQKISADPTLSNYPSADCATDDIVVKITLNLFPPGLPGLGAVFGNPLAAAALLAINKGFSKVMAPGNVPNQAVVSASTWMRKVTSGISVFSSYGIDYGSPDQLHPLVSAGPRYGDTQISSHGYWLKLSHDLEPELPSESVNVVWKVSLKKSKYIDILNQIEVAMKNELNAGPIQNIINAWPNDLVSVFMLLPALPETNADVEYSQLVVGYDLEPNSIGQSCPLLDPKRLGTESGQPPDEEQLPTNPLWNQNDLDIPACPPSIV